MGYVRLAKRVIAEREQARSSSRRSAVAGYVERLAGIPVVQVTLYETEDVAGDVIFLARLRQSLAEHPGVNRVEIAIHSLDGRTNTVMWHALASDALRRRLGQLLNERSGALGMVVDRYTFTCRRCTSGDVAYDPHGRLFCRPCRLKTWSRHTTAGHDHSTRWNQVHRRTCLDTEKKDEPAHDEQTMPGPQDLCGLQDRPSPEPERVRQIGPKPPSYRLFDDMTAITGTNGWQVGETNECARQVSRRVARWTSAIKLRFCEMIAQGASPTKAAEALELTRQSAYYQRSVDPAFAAAWEEAQERAADRYEDALDHLALKTRNVGAVIFQLKNRRPGKWKDRHDVEVERKSEDPLAEIGRVTLDEIARRFLVARADQERLEGPEDVREKR